LFGFFDQYHWHAAAHPFLFTSSDIRWER
jgi:hypothetical protein